MNAIDRQQIIISIIVRYRKGFTLDSAARDVFENWFENGTYLTQRQCAMFKNAAEKELKKLSDWRYDK